MILLDFTDDRRILTRGHIGQRCARIKDYMLRLKQSYFNSADKHASKGDLPMIIRGQRQPFESTLVRRWDNVSSYPNL